MEIHRATDRELLFDVWIRSVRATHTFLSEEDIHSLIAPVKEYLASGESDFWVLRSDEGAVMGFMGMSGSNMESLFLAPEYHRRGGGRLLVKHACSMHGELTVDVNEQNTAARGLPLHTISIGLFGRWMRNIQMPVNPRLLLTTKPESGRSLERSMSRTSNERPFVVLRSRGPGWDDSKPLEGQPEWAAHTAFMDGLFERGFVVFAGPLEGTRDALLILRAASVAEVTERLASDPWTINGLLTTKQISPWQLRLGTLG